MEHFSPKIVEAVETVKTSPSVQRAFDYVKDHLEETIRDQKELVLIEAPTGHEKAKAERYLSMLREAGLDDIYMDEHFNVIGKLHGTGQYRLQCFTRRPFRHRIFFRRRQRD